jgi:shikimate kinase
MPGPIYLTGFMGSGKTTFGRLLAHALNYDFIDLDHLIEEEKKATISELFEKYGEKGFRELERQAIHKSAEFSKTIVATGGGAPCFFDNMDFMNNHGITIYLKLTPEDLAKRLLPANADRPLIAGKSSPELLKFIKEKLSERTPFYEKAKIVSKTSGLSPEETVKIVTSALNLPYT